METRDGPVLPAAKPNRWRSGNASDFLAADRFGVGGSFAARSAVGNMGYLEYFFPGTVLLVLLFTAIFRQSQSSKIERRASCREYWWLRYRAPRSSSVN